MAQLPAFVINLDRRPDRLAAIMENLDRIGVEATRISPSTQHRFPPWKGPTI